MKNTLPGEVKRQFKTVVASALALFVVSAACGIPLPKNLGNGLQEAEKLMPEILELEKQRKVDPYNLALLYVARGTQKRR